MCYTLVYSETQAIRSLSIVLRYMGKLTWVIQFVLHTNSPKLNKSWLKYETSE